MSGLQSSKATAWSKAFLLKMLIHLVGDIHQPLHCITLYNELFPKGDLGGNKFVVFYQTLKNLHSIWDSGIGLYNMDFDRPLNSSSYKVLNELARNITQEYNEGYFGSRAQNLKPNDWANESYNLAIKYSYSDLVNGSNINNNRNYVTAARKIARQQIALAGYRLKNMIKKIPIVTVKHPITSSQMVGVGIGLFFFGIILGSLTVYFIIKSSFFFSYFIGIYTN